MSGEIFLSYAGLDRETATRLKEGLVTAGLEGRVWQDIDQIRGGDNWLKKLEEALQAGAGYLILIGVGGIRHWVKFELYAAVRRHYDTDERYPILPVLLPGVTPEDLPSFLSLFQAERLPEQPSPADYRKLAQRLETLLAAAPAADEGDRPLSAESPWPGLAAYDETQARYFFGRSAEILEALGRFGQSTDGVYRRWLQVEGPSGFGKSSLVHAGLAPAIERGWFGEPTPEAPRPWRVARMRPGGDPLAALALALAGVLDGWQTNPDGLLKRIIQTVPADDASPATKLNPNPEALKLLVRAGVQQAKPPCRLLLVVDQFEEVFGPLVPEQAMAGFDALLTAAVTDPDGPIHLITTIRSDFTLQLQQFMPGLSGLLNRSAGRVVVCRIGVAGLKEIIEKPARLAGLAWDEASLPGRIAEEAARTPNPLPLVGNLLWLLWQQRQGRRLLATVHDTLGGVGGALTKSAGDLWQTLDDDSRIRARGLLLKLVSVGRDRADTRRTISREVALRAAGGGPKAEQVLWRLSGGPGEDGNQPRGPRLITIGAAERQAEPAPGMRPAPGPAVEPSDTVDLAHEALLTHWNLMKSWLADVDTRRQLEAEDALEDAARRWQDDGAPERPGLPEPRVWARYRKANAPSPLAGQYLQALNREQKALDDEAARVRREAEHARRWFRWKLAAAVVSLVLLLGSFLALDIWAERNGASRGLALRAVATRLGWSAPPPIPAMVDIPAGSFQMGSSDADPHAEKDEKPRHAVTLGAFRLGRYETTFAEYDAFLEVVARRDFDCRDWHRVDRPDDQGWGRGRRPVINVSWEDASCYAEWLSFLTGQAYRLPTEAEWEYAARAGTDTPYWWGQEVEPGKAVCDGCEARFAGREQDKKTAEVDDPAFKPNDWGLYHTAGNVREWVADCWHENYEGAPAGQAAWMDGSDGTECASNRRVIRGGSWSDDPANLRSANRGGITPDYRLSDLGFRLAQD